MPEHGVSQCPARSDDEARGPHGDSQELGLAFREHAQVFAHHFESDGIFLTGLLLGDRRILDLEQVLRRLAPCTEVVFVEHVNQLRSRTPARKRGELLEQRENTGTHWGPHRRRPGPYDNQDSRQYLSGLRVISSGVRLGL